ncbi:hypothetical protein RND81_02G168000 [Saponaria officinalis]|uniref:Uncharacterized protein n=1 Tax=Saponaria officinalis TaxID=3572 RepID=A0AAW1MTX4_SAPOF
MSAVLYQIFTSTGLISLGLYHLTSSIHSHLKSPSTFSAKPYHPLPLPNHHHHLRHLSLYITSLSLLLSFLHHSVSSSTPDPLLSVHSFSSLTSAAVSLFFLILSLSLLLPLIPHDLSFAAASAAFFLLHSSSSSRAAVLSSNLESHLLSLSSHVSLLSSLLSLALSLSPRLFVADVALSASVVLQGLWALQTGLSLHVDAFIPEGCHKLLDVVAGVEGSTKCELDESKLRAAAILDLMFVIYVVVVVLIVFGVYTLVSKVTGISTRRFGSYEALPNAVVVDGTSHVQLKTLSGTQA